MKSNKSVRGFIDCIACGKTIVQGNFSSLYVIGEIMDHRCNVTESNVTPSDGLPVVLDVSVPEDTIRILPPSDIDPEFAEGLRFFRLHRHWPGGKSNTCPICNPRSIESSM